MAARAEFVYWDGGARYVPLVCAARATSPPRLAPSHAGGVVLTPQQTAHCSHQHCDLLYGGCAHCPFCATAPPLQPPDDAATRRRRYAELDPFLRVLQKNLDNAIARVHLQSGLADSRDLINDYSVQRAQARVFTYRQKLGLDPPVRPENIMELILRIPTRIKVFRVRNKGYYCHAIALLCGPPVQPYMVSVLEEVSTGALFSAGRMIDVKFRVECPQHLSRKRVLGMLGPVADVQQWTRVVPKPGEIKQSGEEYAPCLDAELVKLVSEEVNKLGNDTTTSTVTVAAPLTKTLVFMQEYITDPRGNNFWWIPAARSDIADTVFKFAYTDKMLWTQRNKYSWIAREEGKKRLFQEKKSELDTNADSVELHHQWDLLEHVTRENVNFTAMCDFEDYRNLRDAKEAWVGELKIADRAKERIKAQLVRLHSDQDVKMGVSARLQTLIAMNEAIVFLQRWVLTPTTTRNVVTVFMAHVDIRPVHWSPRGLQWRRLLTKDVQEERREMPASAFRDQLEGLLAISLEETTAISESVWEAYDEVLPVDYFVRVSDEYCWVPVVEGDKLSRPASAATDTWIDQAPPPPAQKSLFVESREVMVQRYNNMSTPQTLEELIKTIQESQDAELTYVNSARLAVPAVVTFDAGYLKISTAGVNWLLMKLCDDNAVDYLLSDANNSDNSNKTNRRKTLVFPLDFYNKYTLRQRGDAGAGAVSAAGHKLSEYHTLIMPGEGPDGLFFAYVSLQRGGRIAAYLADTGRRSERVRQDLLHFVNSCLLAEYGDERGRIARLNFDAGQPFHAVDQRWRCRNEDQHLLLLACTRYVLDRRVFDFDPGSELDMDEFRVYFVDLLMHYAR